MSRVKNQNLISVKLTHESIKDRTCISLTVQIKLQSYINSALFFFYIILSSKSFDNKREHYISKFDKYYFFTIVTYNVHCVNDLMADN